MQLQQSLVLLESDAELPRLLVPRHRLVKADIVAGGCLSEVQDHFVILNIILLKVVVY